jgi:hypothetical protein
VIIGLFMLYLLARNQHWANTQYERWSQRALSGEADQTTAECPVRRPGCVCDGLRFTVMLWMPLNWGIAILHPMC